MRTRLLIAITFLMLVALAGCGSSGGDGESMSESEPTDDGASYETIEMGPTEEAVYELMPAYVDERYVGWAEENGDVEGEDYLDVRGIEPLLVGYEVVAWKSAGSSEIERIELPYLNGHIAKAYALPDEEEDEAPEIDVASVLNAEHVADPTSAGEQAAIAAAETKLAEVASDFAYEAIGINRYLFLYEKGGMGVVIGLTPDGELGSNSSPIKLAE